MIGRPNKQTKITTTNYIQITRESENYPRTIEAGG